MGWASINVWGVLGSELFAVSSWNRCASIFNMLLLLASSHRPPIASPTPSILIICLASGAAVAAACGGKAAQSQCESLTNPYAKRQLMFALRNGIVRWMLRVLQFRLGTRPLASDSGFGSGSSMVRFFPCWLFVCAFSLPWQMNWRFRAFQLACGTPCSTARQGRARQEALLAMWHGWRRCVALRQCFLTFSQCTFSMGLHSIYFWL